VVESGEVCIWPEFGVWSREGDFVLVSWQGSGFSHSEDVFTLIYFVKIFYKFCTFSAICEDIAAINYRLSLLNTKWSITVIFDVSYAGLLLE
jgi:hypothetical protein